MTKNQYDEFLEDVEKDIRAERFKKIWDRFGKYISAGITVAFLAGSVYFLWAKNQQEQNQQQAMQFMKAQSLISSGQIEQAIFCLKDLELKESSYGMFSKFVLAVQDKKNALNIYKSIISGSSVLFFKDLARVLYVTHSLENTKDFTKLKEMLKPSLVGPWSLLASDLYAFILYQEKNYKEALNYFSAIAKDPKAPEGLKLRAQIFAQECVQRTA